MWSGAEMKKHVEQLTNYWEAINAAALGRTVTPLVSAPLAQEVADSFAEWVDYREGLGGLEFSPAVEDELRSWRGVADRMARAIRSEGQPAPTLEPWEPTLAEQAATAARSVAHATVGLVAVTALAVSLPLVLAIVLRRGSR